MGARIFLAQSTRDLLPRLVERLRTPQADPFAPEILVVPTAGARDWLIERLAHELDPDGAAGDGGILANVEFWFPNEFNLHAVGVEKLAGDAWSKANLRWTILGLLHSGAGTAPAFEDSTKKLAIAERIAHLFDLYGVYRPEMPASWARSDAAKDPQFALDPDKVWQFDLWKVVRAAAGESPGERFIAARGAIDGEKLRESVRGRISVFGLDVFSPAKVSLLAAMSEHLDVDIHAVFPSLDKVDAVRALDLQQHLRREVDVLEVVDHPLARSWGRAGLETMALLTHQLPKAEIVWSDVPDTVLGRLQASIAADASLVATEPFDAAKMLQRGDGSIQIHTCHGPTRQVEVLRDALLHRLADDPTLHPRDIVVVCPDLETYAPLLEPVLGATFTTGSGAGARTLHLPLAIIDKSTATATPVAETIAALFAAVDDRLAATAVMALLSQAPVQRRYRLSDDEVSTLDGWVSDLDVRWGADAEHRAAWGYPLGERAGTWRAALDRLTAGILLQAEEPREAPEGVVPFDDVSGSVIDLIGRLADFFDALDRFRNECGTTKDLRAWADTMDRALDDFVQVPSKERNQLDDAKSVVASMRSSADRTQGALLTARDVANLFAGELDGVRARSRVWGDVVRVASLSRLRGVSARVIAILGFDDRAFATGRGAGDDILLDEPRLGERDFHSEERLGLLGLLSAASDAFIVTCNGHDVTNNAPVPMAVPLEELKDAIAGVIALDPSAGLGHLPVLVQHSRQLADPVNFDLEGSDPAKNVRSTVSGPWSFDPTAASITSRLSTASAVRLRNRDWPRFEWDPSFEAEPLSIAQLHDAIRRPSQLYVRDRLQITLPGRPSESDDAAELWPSGLALHSISTEIIEARRAGVVDLDRRRVRGLMGGVPMGALAEPFWNELEDFVGKLLSVKGVSFEPGELQPIDLEVAGARIVDHVEVTGDDLVRVQFSKASPRHRLRPWLELAAITLTDPSVDREAIVITQNASKTNAQIELLALHGDTDAERRHNAERVLRYAVETRRRALCEAIPLFEYGSWSIAGSVTSIDTELDRDHRYEPSVAVLYEHLDLVHLRRDPYPGEEPRRSRFAHYADELVGTFADTVELRSSKGRKGAIDRDKVGAVEIDRPNFQELDR